MLWNDILFSDQSRFCLNDDSRRQGVYRNAGHHTLPQFTQPVTPSGVSGIMVWGGTSFRCGSDYHVVHGNLTNERYVQDHRVQDITLNDILNLADTIGETL